MSKGHVNVLIAPSSMPILAGQAGDILTVVDATELGDKSARTEEGVEQFRRPH